jgi:hypothetical protein
MLPAGILWGDFVLACIGSVNVVSHRISLFHGGCTVRLWHARVERHCAGEGRAWHGWELCEERRGRQKLDLHPRCTHAYHIEPPGGLVREIEDPMALVGPPISNPTRTTCPLAKFVTIACVPRGAIRGAAVG